MTRSAESHSSVGRLSALVVAGALLAGAAEARAAARPTCVPVARGVPFAQVQYPDIAKLEDPNWLGAVKRAYSFGLPDDVAFRALTFDDGSGPKLYLSWVINHGQNAISFNDSLAFGFTTDNSLTTGKGVRIKITLPSTPVASGTVGASGAATKIQMSTTPADPNAWTKPGNAYAKPAPDWLQNGRFWTIKDGNSWRWVVQLQIPIDPTRTSLDPTDISRGIPLHTVSTGEFNHQRYFFGYVVNTSVMMGTTPALVTSGSWPRNFTPPPGGDDRVLWNIPQWAPFDLGVGSCGQGVAVGAMDVTTDFNDAEIHTASDKPVNVTKFRLNVHNESADIDVPAGAVQSQFQVADWGSQTFTNADWTKVPLSAANGGVIQKKSGVNGSSEQISTSPWLPARCRYANEFPSYSRSEWLAQNGGNEAPLPPDQAVKKATCGWLPEQNTPARDAVKDNHQCLRAEVTGTQNVDIDVASVYRNMSFRTASRFEDKATISIRGLTPIAIDGRDVYVWIEKRNLPAEIASGSNPDCTEGCHGEFCSSELVCNYPYNDSEADVSRMPQLRVHVYHDTGVRFRENGKLVPVLAHQTSYGYLMAHNSMDLYGWSNAFAGPGIKPIGEDLYKIHLPNEGRVKVTNVIEAMETPCLGPVNRDTKVKLGELEKAVREAGSAYGDRIRALRNDSQLRNSTLHRLLEELKLQTWSCDEVVRQIEALDVANRALCSS